MRRQEGKGNRKKEKQEEEQGSQTTTQGWEERQISEKGRGELKIREKEGWNRKKIQRERRRIKRQEGRTMDLLCQDWES